MEKEDRSLWLILAGIAIFSIWYTLTKRTENALWLVLAAVCILILAYRLYGVFVAARAAVLSNGEAATASGHLPTERWVLFGYQFASTAGIGILVGPVLAAQFGYLPGYLWLLIGAVLAGAVHDMVLLVASKRRRGAFLPLLVAAELGPWSGLAVWGIVLVALPLFLAVTASLVADLLVGNVWAVYAVAITVVVAVLVSLYERLLRPSRIGEAIVIGVVLSVAAILFGSRLAMRTVENGVLASRGFMLLLVGAYCFVSATLPIRFLGRARGAISGYIGLLGVAALALGIAFAAPSLRQPATTVRFSRAGQHRPHQPLADA